ncbi:phosphatase PAP2 family protein [Actinoplanes sp. NPDC051475]|uniref:phosphatase PAP2 family protein n=1 Tax=Actinoplanes sp. NPDC051475 TaxID=3157225 RepID=UPI00344B3136
MLIAAAPASCTRWFLDVNHLAPHTPWLHTPVKAYADCGALLFALLLLAGWWTARRRANITVMSAALWAPAGMLLAAAVNQPIAAAVVGEARPYTTLPHILVLATLSTDPSFPSDHATMAGAGAAGLLLVSWRLGLTAVVAAAGMGFARVYVGAHYPQDVLAGLALGALVTLMSYLVARRALAGSRSPTSSAPGKTPPSVGKPTGAAANARPPQPSSGSTSPKANTASRPTAAPPAPFQAPRRTPVSTSTAHGGGHARASQGTTTRRYNAPSARTPTSLLA